MPDRRFAIVVVGLLRRVVGGEDGSGRSSLRVLLLWNGSW